jgi:hypothetical protein
MHFACGVRSKGQLPRAARCCATRRLLVLVPAPPPSPLFRAANACFAVLDALGGTYVKMSGLIPPALAVAYAVVVGQYGAEFFTGFAEVVKNSAREAAEQRAIHALGQRVKVLGNRVDVGCKLVTRQFQDMERNVETKFREMDTKMDKRFMSMEDKMDKRFKSIENKMEKRFVGMDKRFNNLEQQFTIVLKPLERK